MSSARVRVGALQISKILFNFVNQEVVPGTNIDPYAFWTGAQSIINEMAPVNRALLKRRDELQAQLDEWHQMHKGEHNDIVSYKSFLYKIGYLVPRNDNDVFQIATSNVDDEIVKQAGPQLVVPLMNARFTLNAANARWGSLYDALYGTDAIPEIDGCEKTAKYNKKRGDKVITFTRQFLDQNVPLTGGKSHGNAKKYFVDDGKLKVALNDGYIYELRDPDQFLGYQGDSSSLKCILLKHNGLHIEIQIDPSNSRGDPAGIKDVILESAVTTIVDCEDSVAAVDAEDKVELYRNWLGLMKGSLEAEFLKGKTKVMRRLNPDRIYTSKNGTKLQLHGRSLLFIRHVGHLLYTDAILDKDDREIPEGILDALVTTLIALHDLKGNTTDGIRNSRTGSIYVVKPKQHGPAEVAFTTRLFSRVEELLKLPRNTLKMGVMDEERRTTLNLSACIREVKDRLVFINTGFLDRTGDDIHTSMEAGPLVRKSQMKETKWLAAYEKNNVDVGLRHGLPGKAQIGKGMWAMPDMMAAMMQQKVGHPKAGANCAWVPSPTAATLHALHYHQVDVFARQTELVSTCSSKDYLDDLLTIPILTTKLSSQEIQRELDNNAQSILGYVVRWIDQGIGCSKVPDIDNIGLMEDRATLRISSQLIANWLRHRLVNKEQVVQSFQRMARVVDQQNADSQEYKAMAVNFENNIAFQAALELVLEGHKQPNGYTEPILHRRRREFKTREKATSKPIVRSSL